MGIYVLHSGVKNMKWGVRRYQNKDGTWTSLGKKRRAVMERGASDKPEKEEPKKNDISSMSDDDLRKGISRFQLEEQYNTYLAKRNPKKKSRAKEVAAKLMENAAMTFGTKAIDAIASATFEKKKPPEKAIDLDSLTPEKLKRMPKSQLDKVNAYAEALGKARKAIEKTSLNEETMNQRIADIQNFTKLKASGKAYFDALSSEGATEDERAYYAWLGEHAMYNRS